MARGRLISKSLGSSRRFHDVLRVGGKVGEFCQVLFPLIVANTDDFGRMPGDAFTVKNIVLPSSRRLESDFDRALDALADVGLVERYTVNGEIYLQVNKFDEHQPNLQKRTKSRFPEFPGSSGNFRLNLTESNLTQFKRTQNPEPREAPVRDGFDRFWDAYPKKKAKDDARKAWDRRRPDAALTNVMIAAIEQQSQSEDWRKERGRYVPFPATWLNRGQWTDSAEEVTAEVERCTCPHSPTCDNPGNWRCQQRTVLETARAEKAASA